MGYSAEADFLFTPTSSSLLSVSSNKHTIIDLVTESQNGHGQSGFCLFDNQYKMQIFNESLRDCGLCYI